MIDVIISDELIYSFSSKDFDITVYGNIYNKDQLRELKNYNSDFDIGKFAMNLSGYFLIIIKSRDEFIILNDIYGNYRLYFSYDLENKYFLCSNEYQKVNSKVNFELNIYEKIYLKRQKYTSGFGSINRNIKKLLPGSILKINKDHYTSNIYFSSAKAKRINQDDYIQKIHELIKSNILENIHKNKKTILFFSGGVDSVYLSEIMRKNIKDMLLVFIKYDYPDSDNLEDFEKIKKYISKTNLELEVIDYKTSNLDQSVNQTYQNQPHDISLGSFYDAHKYLSEKYGCCNVVNGQSSDSIFCWGNSSFTTGAFLQRILASKIFYNLPSLVRLVISKVIEMLYKSRRNLEGFSVPYSKESILIGLLDPDGYLPVLSKNQLYNRYLNDIIDLIKRDLSDTKDIIFYIKLMYLQGPSNIPWVYSSKKYKHNLIMPFLDSRMSSMKVKNQNEFKQLFSPRYELLKTLDKKYALPEKYFNFKKYILSHEEQVLISKYHEKLDKFNKLYFEKICGN